MKNLTIGRKIAKLRKINDMSQKDLAKKLNVSDKLVSKWECDNGTPDINMIQELSKIFNVSVNELLENQILAKRSKTRKKVVVCIISVVILICCVIGIVLGTTLPKNNGQNTPPNNPEINNRINLTSNLFDINKNELTLYCSLSNNTESINLNNSISVSDDYVWRLYKDIECIQEIPSKSINLEIGDNKLFILISNSNEQQLYKLTIRRRPLYTISFNTNSDENIPNQIIEEGGLIKIPNNPTKKGYTFSGWDYDLSQPIVNSLQINAKYNANSYKVIYHNGDSENFIIQNVIFDELTTLYDKNTFNKSNYSLTHWNTQINDNGEVFLCGANYTNTTAENLQLYAIWEPIQYQISYELNGGTNNKNNPNSYNVEDLEILLYEPIKNGYQFDGWYLDDTFKTQISAIQIDNISNITLYAKWTYISIYNVEDLKTYLSKSLNWSGEFKLFDNIDLSGSEWNPIGNETIRFTGIFDGNGYTISNFTLLENKQNNGFFGYVYNATIKNLSLKDINVAFSFDKNRCYVGGLAGQIVYSTIKNCDTSGQITCTSSSTNASSNIGGLVGDVTSSTIEESYSTVSIENNVSYATNIGGLVGYIRSGKILNSYATGNVESVTSFSSVSVGGLIGQTYVYNDLLDIVNCYSSGNCTAKSRTPSVGGLIGEIRVYYTTGTIHDINSFVNLKNCYTTGNVYSETEENDDKATTYIGALYGRIYNYSSDYEISNCFVFNEQVLLSNGGRYKYTNNFDSSAKLSLSDIWLFINGNWNSEIWNLYLDKNPTLK